jgi:PEGA domain
MLREPLPDNPSPALSQAYERAQGVLEAAKPRIAALNIAVEVPEKVNAKVIVDGKEISSAVLGADLPADPGRHVVSITASGYLTATQEVYIQAGGREVVSLKLVKDPNAAPEPAPAETHDGEPRGTVARSNASLSPQSERPVPVEDQGGSRVPAYLSWAVGAVGVGVGIGFGVSALGAKNDLATNCPNQQCDPAFAGDLDDAKMKGNIATIGFAVGGAGLLLGTIFFAASGSDEKDPAAASSQPSGLAAYRPRAWLSPGSVHFAADF